ncbi:MAG: zinc ribbon domain-containing protein [Oscillospiraceae bacterium]|nr:zinc ribbon domain-containing protein [Oscillospiraceae bacterium]
MLCPHCNAEFTQRLKFCPRCGAPKPEEPSGASQETSHGASHQTYREYREVPFFVNAENAQQYGPKRTFDDESIRRFLIGFILVSIAVVGFVVFLVARGN